MNASNSTAERQFTRQFFMCVAFMAGLIGIAFAETGAEPRPANLTDGATVFNNACIACHQKGGIGMPGLAPALVGTLTKRLKSDQGKRYVALVLLNGLSGKIRSQEMEFNGAMPAQISMENAQLAAVANYLAYDLNGLADTQPTAVVDRVFKSEDFERARSEKISHKALRELRDKTEP